MLPYNDVFSVHHRHYSLRSAALISEIIPKLKMQPRVRILVVIYGAFFAHTIEVWVFACAYYLLSTHLEMGAFHGLGTTDFFDFVYFSVVVYTSVGFGDILPQGHLRLIAYSCCGIEIAYLTQP